MGPPTRSPEARRRARCVLAVAFRLRHARARVAAAGSAIVCVRVAVGHLACLLGAIAVLVSAPSARAHVGHEVTRAERYLKIDVGARHVRLVVSLTLGPDEGARVLRNADLDRDGRVSASETERYLDAWATGLASELPVRVDGVPRALAWQDGFMEPSGLVRRTALTLELVGHADLDGGEQELRVVDAMVGREVFDRTDVSFQARDGARFAAAGLAAADGATPDTVTLDVAYGPPRSGDPDVVLIGRVVTPNAPHPSRPVGAGQLVVAVVTAALAMALVWLSSLGPRPRRTKH